MRKVLIILKRFKSVFLIEVKRIFWSGETG